MLQCRLTNGVSLLGPLFPPFHCGVAVSSGNAIHVDPSDEIVAKNGTPRSRHCVFAISAPLRGDPCPQPIFKFSMDKSFPRLCNSYRRPPPPLFPTLGFISRKKRIPWMKRAVYFRGNRGRQKIVC